MKTAKTNWIGTILSCLCDIAGFVTITYLLGCADFSFSKSPVSILLFAYSTTLGWSHYGTKAVEYLFGTTGSRIYKVVFVCMTVVGATMKLGLAWDLSDTFNGLMMIPNLIGVLVLSGTVVDITRNYFDRRVKGKDIEPMWSAFLEYQKQEEAEAAAEEAELEKAANE